MILPVVMVLGKDQLYIEYACNIIHTLNYAILVHVS